MNWLRSALVGVAATATLLVGTGSSYAGGPREDRYGGISWAGFFVGVQGGYAWGDTAHTAPSFATPIRDIEGGLFGITWGTNWQSGNWVYGTESDFSLSSVDGDVAPGCAPGACFTEIRNLSTSRVRLGYAMDNRLVYVTGGLAYGTVRAGIHGTSAQDDETRFGWALGAGLEWAFAPRWSVKAEYMHIDLGDNRNYRTPTERVDVDVTADIFRVGVNYNLGPNFLGNLIGWR